ncbi:MAG: hypothetical protein A2V86_01355 [Deltaproteobacteria bacterium RBG_16_49_23]|nr:MAG: hypothetical protein A2V86_01355 [Deltaproteobacteria bacterium RBG_16_49_23]
MGPPSPLSPPAEGRGDFWETFQRKLEINPQTFWCKYLKMLSKGLTFSSFFPPFLRAPKKYLLLSDFTDFPLFINVFLICVIGTQSA